LLEGSCYAVYIIIWEFSESRYFTQIDKHGTGANVIHLIPQGTLRRAVMGTANRRPNPKELDEMRRKIDEYMQAGAWSKSTGLIYHHGYRQDSDLT